MIPIVTAMVVYVLPDGQERPAIVTRVLAGEIVNLQVFPDYGDAILMGRTSGTVPQTSVRFGFGPGEWHWPTQAKGNTTTKRAAAGV